MLPILIDSIFQDSIMQAVQDLHSYFHITFDRLTTGKDVTTDRSLEITNSTDSIQYAHVLWQLPASSSSPGHSQAGIEQDRDRSDSDLYRTTLRPEHKRSDDKDVHGSSNKKDSSSVRTTLETPLYASRADIHVMFFRCY